MRSEDRHPTIIFCPCVVQNPIKLDEQTASGLLMGKVKGTKKILISVPR
jgi:hypothetical protein